MQAAVLNVLEEMSLLNLPPESEEEAERTVERLEK